jgi:hypothetical protein
MIDFRGEVTQMKRIRRAIALFSHDDYDKLYTIVSRCSHEEYWSPFRSAIDFGFDIHGRPGYKYNLGHGAVSMERGSRKHGYRKCLIKFRDTTITVSYSHGGQVDQIYLTINKEHPKYRVYALGKSFAVDQNKHPDFFLSTEELSYAVLLGHEPMLGASEFIACAECIFDFAFTMESSIMLGSGGADASYSALTRSDAYANIRHIW